MTFKTITSLLGLALLLNSGFSVFAQQTPAEIAEEEAVRRQEAIQLLHMKVADAQALLKAGRILEASKVFEDAYSLFPKIGPTGPAVEQDRAAVIAGLVDARLKLGDLARKRGDLQEADSQVKRALKVDPQNAAALQFKLENDRAIAGSKGNIPSTETLSKIPEFQNEKVQVGTLVQDGKLLFETGKLDEAEVKLKQAMQADPDSKAAQYYLNLIRDQRYRREGMKRDIASRDALVEVAKAWNPPQKRDELPFPNPLMRTNLIYTSPQRQEIMAKLNSIRLNEVGYVQLPLVEVLKALKDESIKRDPDHVGLNFMINPHSDVPAITQPTDPNQQGTVEPAPVVDISTATIKIEPPLSNVRLADVLDAITTSADQPIRYEVRDYAIVFSPKTPEPVALYTRRFKVDPNTFLQGLESIVALSLGDSIGSGTSGGGGSRGGGGGQQGNISFNVPRVQLAQVVSGRGGGAGGGIQGVGLKFVSKTNYTAEVNMMVRDYFSTAGVDLTQAGKSVFFNDRTGILLVRATLQDLEIIETAVQALNTAPPQVQIEAKFAEVSQSDNKGLGFDWFIGNTLLGGGRVGMQGGTAPSFAGKSTKANPSGIFPHPGIAPGVPDPTPGATILPKPTDGLISQSIRNTYGDKSAPIPELGTLTGILTDPQFRMVIRAIEQRGGADILAAPKVTTLSGRQAQINALDLRTIVTGVDLQNINNTQPIQNTGGNNLIQNSQPAFQPNTDPIPFGPSLDVIPYVSADGFSIQMTILPTMTEFVEYEDPGAFAPTAFTQQGDQARAALPLPRLRIRQVTTSCIVYDGQTVVLGGLIAENIVKVKDKVPMLGDLPGIGRLFRSESSTSDKRNLMIFVTPTIIDPAGNRVHSDDELPFARSTIPPQASATP